MSRGRSVRRCPIVQELLLLLLLAVAHGVVHTVAHATVHTVAHAVPVHQLLSTVLLLRWRQLLLVLLLLLPVAIALRRLCSMATTTIDVGQGRRALVGQLSLLRGQERSRTKTA